MQSIEQASPFHFFLVHPNIVLLEWHEAPSDTLLLQLVSFRNELLNKFETIYQITQGYRSLMLYHHHKIERVDVYNEELLSVFGAISNKLSISEKKWEIPVCYDKQLAMDLAPLADALKLTIQELVELHSSATYRVYFIGFLPGFLYLNGLPKKLEYARKNQPSARVEAGSIAIGGKQTGIYPSASPGGWHIIGRTPYPLFRPKMEHPCFAQAGDLIQFKSISLEEFNELALQSKNNTLSIQPL